jgi:hypothetical protein
VLHATCANGTWSDPGDCSAVLCQWCSCEDGGRLTCRYGATSPAMAPSGVPVNTTRLELAAEGLSLPLLDLDSRTLDGLTGLTSIVLRRFDLQRLERDTFAALPALTDLLMAVVRVPQLPFVLRSRSLDRIVHQGSIFVESSAARLLNVSQLIEDLPRLREYFLPVSGALEAIVGRPGDQHTQLEVLALTATSCQGFLLGAFPNLINLELVCLGDSSLHVTRAMLPATGRLVRLCLVANLLERVDPDAFVGGLNFFSIAKNGFQLAPTEGVACYPHQILLSDTGGSGIQCRPAIAPLAYEMRCNCTSPRFVDAPGCAPANPVTCGNGSSIDVTRVCDGQVDCPDGRDERFCDAALELVSTALNVDLGINCYRNFTVAVRRGVLRWQPFKRREVGMDTDTGCFSGSALLRDFRAAEGTSGLGSFR